MYLGHIPPSSRLLVIWNAYFAIKTYHSTPSKTTRTPDVLAVSNKSRFTLQMRQSLHCIAKIRLRLPLTVTMGSCRAHAWFWMNSASLQSYSKDSFKRCSSRARQAIATPFAASRGKCFVGHLFNWLYRSRRRAVGGFLQIYWKTSHRYGCKKKPRFAIQLQYRTVDSVYNFHGYICCIRSLLFSLHATSRQSDAHTHG